MYVRYHMSHIFDSLNFIHLNNLFFGHFYEVPLTKISYRIVAGFSIESV